MAFSTPITAQPEPTTLETLVETLGGSVRHNAQGEIVDVTLFRIQITDAGLAHLTGLTALESLYLRSTQITDAGLALLTGLTVLENLDLGDTQVTQYAERLHQCHCRRSTTG